MAAPDDVVNLETALARVAERWSPKIVGEVNGSHLKVVKLLGDFVWHHHDEPDDAGGARTHPAEWL